MDLDRLYQWGLHCCCRLDSRECTLCMYPNVCMFSDSMSVCRHEGNTLSTKYCWAHGTVSGYLASVCTDSCRKVFFFPSQNKAVQRFLPQHIFCVCVNAPHASVCFSALMCASDVLCRGTACPHPLLLLPVLRQHGRSGSDKRGRMMWTHLCPPGSTQVQQLPMAHGELMSTCD